MRVGNKMNSFLNGEWAKHVGPYCKRYTSKARRNFKDLNKEQVQEIKQSISSDGYDAFLEMYRYDD